LRKLNLRALKKIKELIQEYSVNKEKLSLDITDAKVQMLTFYNTVS
jgi:hypothetical protein